MHGLILHVRLMDQISCRFNTVTPHCMHTHVNNGYINISSIYNVCVRLWTKSMDVIVNAWHGQAAHSRLDLWLTQFHNKGMECPFECKLWLRSLIYCITVDRALTLKKSDILSGVIGAVLFLCVAGFVIM